jgi:hypothetical protein
MIALALSVSACRNACLQEHPPIPLERRLEGNARSRKTKKYPAKCEVSHETMMHPTG